MTAVLSLFTSLTTYTVYYGKRARERERERNEEGKEGGRGRERKNGMRKEGKEGGREGKKRKTKERRKEGRKRLNTNVLFFPRKTQFRSSGQTAFPELPSSPTQCFPHHRHDECFLRMKH